MSEHAQERVSPALGVGARVAVAIGLVGVAVYNWWIVAAASGILPSPNLMFSDLKASGEPYAATFSHLDIIAAVAMLAALTLLGSNGRHREWLLLIGFALAGLAGGLLPYTCPEALDASCRRAEWHLQLPLERYGHVIAGMVEFALATTVIVMTHRRLRTSQSPWRHVATTLWTLMLIGYPLLAVAYLTDRWGAFVEPIFLVAFSARLAMALFEEPAA